MIEEINYKVHPKLFSNSALVSVDLFERVAEVLQGDKTLQAIDLLSLQSIAEAVILQDKIILEDHRVVGGAQVVEGDGSPALIELIRALNKGRIFDQETVETSASSTLQYEATILSTPGAEPVRVNYFHESHIIIEHFEDESQTIPVTDFSSENLQSRISKTWSATYAIALEETGDYYEDGSGFVPQPWKLLADCHGIPYIDNPFYSLRAVNSIVPTNIGTDLYRKLENLHKDYFKKIERYLGPTYVNLPPILNLVLERSHRPEDIPSSLISVRDQFKDFRKACTSLESELRQSAKISQQIEIIREIEAVYTALTKRIEKPKNRVLLRLFDILKQVDPIHMTTKALDQIKEYIVEEEGLIKMPSYFDLWKALTQAKQNSAGLKNIFGSQVSPTILQDIQEIKRVIDAGEFDLYDWEDFDKDE